MTLDNILYKIKKIKEFFYKKLFESYHLVEFKKINICYSLHYIFYLRSPIFLSLDSSSVLKKFIHIMLNFQNFIVKINQSLST